MTTAADVVGRIYHELGILSKGHLIEVGRDDLVSQYIGHTAIKTKEVVDTAIGGVLFIRDAYTLDEGDSILRAFGNEAMDVIARAIEEHSDDLVVIMSGGKDEMRAFVNANPGLCLGFKIQIEFD
jgi:stage V sporulation protein K